MLAARRRRHRRAGGPPHRTEADFDNHSHSGYKTRYASPSPAPRVAPCPPWRPAVAAGPPARSGSRLDGAAAGAPPGGTAVGRGLVLPAPVRRRSRSAATHVRVTSLTKPGAEPHDLELSPAGRRRGGRGAASSSTPKGFQPAVDDGRRPGGQPTAPSTSPAAANLDLATPPRTARTGETAAARRPRPPRRTRPALLARPAALRRRRAGHRPRGSAQADPAHAATTPQNADGLRRHARGARRRAAARASRRCARKDARHQPRRLRLPRRALRASARSASPASPPRPSRGRAARAGRRLRQAHHGVTTIYAGDPRRAGVRRDRRQEHGRDGRDPRPDRGHHRAPPPAATTSRSCGQQPRGAARPARAAHEPPRRDRRRRRCRRRSARRGLRLRRQRPSSDVTLDDPPRRGRGDRSGPNGSGKSTLVKGLLGLNDRARRAACRSSASPSDDFARPRPPRLRAPAAHPLGLGARDGRGDRRDRAAAAHRLARAAARHRPADRRPRPRGRRPRRPRRAPTSAPSPAASSAACSSPARSPAEPDVLIMDEPTAGRRRRQPARARRRARPARRARRHDGHRHPRARRARAPSSPASSSSTAAGSAFDGTPRRTSPREQSAVAPRPRQPPPRPRADGTAPSAAPRHRSTARRPAGGRP